MFEHITHIRVRYGETDQMGYCYYGNYPEYYEVARTESLRSLGMSYRQLEEMGYMLPVRSLNVRYKEPARYDDLLSVKTMIKEMPGMKIQFFYEIRNEAGKLLNSGDTVLVFVDAKSRRLTSAPQALIEVLEPYFKS